MENIQFEKSDYQSLIENLLIIQNIYPSGNRRDYISNLGLLYSSNKITLKTIQVGIIYFKILKATTEDISIENAERLEEVIKILEKYDKT